MELQNESYFPNDIIFNICSRLPTKTICTCRCLSKQWRYVLSTPHFIKTHLNNIRVISDNSFSLIVYPPLFKCLTLSYAHQLFDEITVSAKRLRFGAPPYSCTKILCSCDGLVLAGNKNNNKYLINPTTRAIRELPLSPFALYGPGSSTMYGLGYDSFSDDYKIVMVCYDYNVVHRLMPGCSNTVVYVYSVKNGTWKRCETSPHDLDVDIEPKTSGVFVENCLHWIARRTKDNSIVVAAFNVEDEKFYEVPTYSSIDNDKSRFHYLEVLAGCLCICSNRFDVWMMKEYGMQESWTELVTFEAKRAWFKPLCLLGRENLVLRKYDRYTTMDRTLVTYNLKEKTFKDVVPRGMANDNFALWIPFMETLVSPHCSNEMGREC